MSNDCIIVRRWHFIIIRLFVDHIIIPLCSLPPLLSFIPVVIFVTDYDVVISRLTTVLIYVIISFRRVFVSLSGFSYFFFFFFALSSSLLLDSSSSFSRFDAMREANSVNPLPPPPLPPPLPPKQHLQHILTNATPPHLKKIHAPNKRITIGTTNLNHLKILNKFFNLFQISL